MSIFFMECIGWMRDPQTGERFEAIAVFEEDPVTQDGPDVRAYCLSVEDAERVRAALVAASGELARGRQEMSER